MKYYNVSPYLDYTIAEEYFDDEALKILNCQNVKLIKKHSEYNPDYVCFNFALEKIHKWIDSCENAYNILKEEYEQINIKQAEKGDIISYHEIFEDGGYDNKNPSEINVLHFAIIKETKGTLKSTIIQSKWGNDGVFESTLEEIPNIYGNCIVIWRKKEKINDFNG